MEMAVFAVVVVIALLVWGFVSAGKSGGAPAPAPGTARSVMGGTALAEFSARHAFYSKIVGVSFGNRAASVRRLEDEELVLLVREPENPADANAVAVFSKSHRQLGYLPARTAEKVAEFMDSGGRVMASVSALTGGGGDRPPGANLLLGFDGTDEEIAAVSVRGARK